MSRADAIAAASVMRTTSSARLRSCMAAGVTRSPWCARRSPCDGPGMSRSMIVALAIVITSSSVAFAEPDRSVVIDVGKPMRTRARWVALGGVALWTASLGVSLYAKHDYDAAGRELGPLPL